MAPGNCCPTSPDPLHRYTFVVSSGPTNVVDPVPLAYDN